MTLVATLIANPACPAITGAVLTEARDALSTTHPPRLLHHGVAAELLVDASIDTARELTTRLRAVLAGAPGATEIGDRRAAIAAAIAEAGPEDIVLIAGKGHEQGQIVGEMELPFDDVTVARECAA